MLKLVFVLLFLLPFQISAQESRFLSYGEFQTLTYAQKQQYIQALQQLVTDLSQNPLFVSDRSYSIPSKWYGWIEKSHASTLEQLCTVRSAKNYSNDDLIGKVQSMNDCREPRSPQQKAASTPFLSPVPGSLIALSEEMTERLQTGRMNIKNYKVRDTKGILLGHIREARNHGVQDKSVDSELKSAAEKLQGSFGTSQSPKEDSKVEVAKNEAKSQEARKASGAVEGQCLYAGFVIPKSNKGCQPYRQLPESFSEIFDRADFLCESHKEIICNPLLFGFAERCGSEEKKPCKIKRPVCVERSRHATRNCQNKAEELETLSSVNNIILGPQGEQQYDEFVASLQSLCDPAQLDKRNLRSFTRKDIEQTCQVAFASFEAHIEKLRLPSKYQPASEKQETVQ